MGKIFGANTKISGKVGQLLYRQTRTGTFISELPVKPVTPRRSTIMGGCAALPLIIFSSFFGGCAASHYPSLS